MIPFTPVDNGPYQGTDLRHAAQELEHQALHAWKLGFRHPRTEEEILVEASLPEPMRTLLTWFPGLV